MLRPVRFMQMMMLVWEYVAGCYLPLMASYSVQVRVAAPWVVGSGCCGISFRVRIGVIRYGPGSSSQDLMIMELIVPITDGCVLLVRCMDNCSRLHSIRPIIKQPDRATKFDAHVPVRVHQSPCSVWFARSTLGTGLITSYVQSSVHVPRRQP